jgi:hypothetical protein
LLCMQFSFGLNNNENLTPDDILTMKGNALKAGLEIATTIIVNSILNETFHSDLAQFQQIQEALEATIPNLPLPVMAFPNATNQGHRRTRFIYEGAELAVYNALKYLFGREYARILMNTYGYLIDLRSSLHWGRYHRELAKSLEHYRRLHEETRRLVHYSDRFPPQLINATENASCPQDEKTDCAILTIETCVVLDEGDKSTFIEKCMESGIRYALLSGDFQNAIPPEYLP